MKATPITCRKGGEGEGGGGGADLLADANDDVGIAGSEVADGEVHPSHHAHLHQPDEMVQHGGFPLLSPLKFSLPTQPPQVFSVVCWFLDGFLWFFLFDLPLPCGL